jgi:hypothetical protein
MAVATAIAAIDIIALYFDLPETKSNARDTRTHLSDEPVEREQMGASFAWSA